MTNQKSILEALKHTGKLLNDIVFMCECRAKSTYFTRHCKMGFKDVIMFTMNFVKKSLQIELDLFFKDIKGGASGITKQSFSEARQKILPEAFRRMFYDIIEWYYDDDSFRKFMGYRLLAVDGSMIEINNSQRLRDAYGYGGNGEAKVARALVSGIYDIENDMMVAAKITHCKTVERKVAIDLIEELKKLGYKNDLFIFDRGYPATDLVSYLQRQGVFYLMRVSRMFLREINQAKEPDQIVEIRDKDKKAIKVRVIRLMLDSGEEELLITNLFDTHLGASEFKSLYFKRWGIETKYDELKNRLQIENFTGDTPVAVEQDFYASMYLANMAAIAKTEANLKIKERNDGKVLKYEYKVNANVLIGKLKDSLILTLLEENPRKRKKLLRKIIEEISRNVIPIRPERSNIRNKGLKSNKFPLNRKRCL